MGGADLIGFALCLHYTAVFIYVNKYQDLEVFSI